MVCTFCGDPAAHEATGCRYGARTLACHACVLSFWKWFRQHNNGRPRAKKLPTPARSFYEAAGDHVPGS